MQYRVATFYKFTPISEMESLKPCMLATMHAMEIKGTIILACEGINGTICGTSQDIHTFCTWLQEQHDIQTLTIKTSYCDFNPFDKAKVKIRKEAVTMGIPDINPNLRTGKHLDADAWNKLLTQDNVLVIDTRNDYEIELGTFQGAINPNTENFRNFPEYVEKHLSAHKDKKIAMFCTGGVRCEKSTADLIEHGFQDVYQLDGGVLKYLETVREDQSLWQGNCFVFDNRVALDQNLHALPPGSIDIEFKNKYKKNNKSRVND